MSHDSFHRFCRWRAIRSLGALVVGGWLMLLLLSACAGARAPTSMNKQAAPSSATAAGSGWAIKPVPMPVGSRRTALTAVSCTPYAGGPASTASVGSVCTAVGYATVAPMGTSEVSAERKVAMAERWDGTRWSILRIAVPAGSRESVLNGVSCTSHGACIAVGSFTNHEGTFALIERWNGARWAIQAAPRPSGSGSSVLDGVSCTSSSACTAVGSLTTTSGSALGALVGRWNGSTWSIQPTPKVRNAGLVGVSCTSATSCMAVGYADPYDLIRGFGCTEPLLAERWNGSRWLLLPSVCRLGFYEFGALTSVSCGSQNTCMAAGWSGDHGVAPWGAAVHWNGSQWSSTSPAPGGPVATGISCASDTNCIMTGGPEGFQSFRHESVRRWTGRRWTTEANLLPRIELAAVSCTPEMCMATGHTTDHLEKAVSVLRRP
jgi:hypothetical protein